MDRLTYWCPDGKGGGEWRANVRGTEVKGAEIDRLASYENTGLTPDEIQALRHDCVCIEAEITEEAFEELREKLRKGCGRSLVLPGGWEL